jgi:hypothetical protein
MTDRELLELAAKAAGWTWWRSKHGYWNLTAPDGRQYDACHNWPAFDASTGEKLAEPTVYDALIEAGFDPENNDGDALRLAVKLSINIEHSRILAGKPHGVNCWPVGRGDCGYTETDIGDYLAATRRAITRAAAEIGRNMT